MNRAPNGCGSGIALTDIHRKVRVDFVHLINLHASNEINLKQR